MVGALRVEFARDLAPGPLPAARRSQCRGGQDRGHIQAQGEGGSQRGRLAGQEKLHFAPASGAGASHVTPFPELVSLPCCHGTPCVVPGTSASCSGRFGCVSGASCTHTVQMLSPTPPADPVHASGLQPSPAAQPERQVFACEGDDGDATSRNHRASPPMQGKCMGKVSGLVAPGLAEGCTSLCHREHNAWV